VRGLDRIRRLNPGAIVVVFIPKARSPYELVDDGREHFNFRDFVKAYAARHGQSTQLLQEKTVLPTDSGAEDPLFFCFRRDRCNRSPAFPETSRRQPFVALWFRPNFPVSVTLCWAPRFLWYASVPLCCGPTTVYSQGKPLKTEYAKCVRDSNGRDVASRSLQTPVFDSKQGFKAYGLVVASYLPEGICKNTSTVYLAEPAGTFRVALQQTQELLPNGSVYDGNGIETLQWSPSGTRLLIEMSQWTWGTDAGSYTKYILVTASGDRARELPIVSAIEGYFAQPCVRLVSSKGWLDDTHIGIEINSDKDADEEAKLGTTRPCFGTTTQFSFDIDSGDLLSGNKSRSLTMSAVSSAFWSTLLQALREERHFALVVELRVSKTDPSGRKSQLQLSTHTLLSGMSFSQRDG
jgi:hypothetical protein